MKKKTLSLMLSVSMLVSLAACGQTAADTSGKVGESSAVTAETSAAVASSVAETKAEESSEQTDSCEANGHEWLENTPNYQQPKTCAKCGTTEGEPLKAENEWMSFVAADTVTDMTMILDDDPEKTNVAKVWFDNYRIFDSDETHEAKDGYEWRSVDMHIAIGDDTEYKEFSCYESNTVGEYYQDNDWDNDMKNITVNYYGKDYICEHEFKVLHEEINVPNPDYKKYGWSGEKTSTIEYNEAFLVPKGFDGFFIQFLDSSEFKLKNEDYQAIENTVSFRLD